MSRVARRPFSSLPRCWNRNESIVADGSCRSPVDGSLLPLCIELAVTQTNFIVECANEFKADPHCGTFLEVHRPGFAEKIGEARLRAMYPSGYRMTVLAWPRQAVRGGPKTQPLWKAVVGSDAPDAMDMVAAAVKEYQYTNKDRRSALFDGLCHPKAAVEILWYEGRIDNGRYIGDLICTRTTPTMEGCRVTIDNLMAALPRVRGQDGRDYPTLAPFVARVQPSDKIPMKSKTQDWEEYAISMSPMTTADSAETQQGFAGAKAAFDHWLQNGGYNADVDAKIKKWNDTTITQEQGDVLYAVSQARR
jgi:hypothetical protein